MKPTDDPLGDLWAGEDVLPVSSRADRNSPSVRLNGFGEPPRPLTHLERVEARIRRFRGRVGWSLRRLGAWIDGGCP